MLALTTCSDFNRAWQVLQKYGDPMVYTKVYSSPDTFAVVHIAGYNTQCITVAGETRTLMDSSNIGEITKKAKVLLPAITAVTVCIEYPDRLYSASATDSVDNPEIITILFKQVVSQVCRERA